MPRLQGRVALVTGANRGIGLAAAQLLASEGARVAVAARNGDAATSVAAEIGGGAFAIVLDVADEAACERAVDMVVHRAERIDVLVNNAGVLLDEHDDTEHVAVEAFDATFRVNVRGPLLLMQRAVPYMRQSRFGRIVNITSEMGRFSAGMAGYSPAYRASKAALNALTANLAAELSGTGVLVNAVDPGWVRTRMGGAGAPGDAQTAARAIVAVVCLPDDGPTGKVFRDGRVMPF